MGSDHTFWQVSWVGADGPAGKKTDLTPFISSEVKPGEGVNGIYSKSLNKLQVENGNP